MSLNKSSGIAQFADHGSLGSFAISAELKTSTLYEYPSCLMLRSKKRIINDVLISWIRTNPPGRKILEHSSKNLAGLAKW
jgi:hypothetical protein